MAANLKLLNYIPIFVSTPEKLPQQLTSSELIAEVTRLRVSIAITTYRSNILTYSDRGQSFTKVGRGESDTDRKERAFDEADKQP